MIIKITHPAHERGRLLASEPVGGRSQATELPCCTLWLICICDKLWLTNYIYNLLFLSLLSQGQTATSVEEEKRFNPRLTKTKGEFIKIMNELGLPYPKQLGNKPLLTLWC